MRNEELNNYLAIAFIIEGAGLFIWWLIAMYFVGNNMKFTHRAKYLFWAHLIITILTGISIILTYKP